MDDTAHISDYLDLSKWIIAGWLVGLIFGVMVDRYAVFGNPLIEGITRFTVGYSDTMGSCLGVVLHRLRKGRSEAEPFVIGMLVGTLVGPLAHFAVVRSHLRPTGIVGAFYAIAYSNSDSWFGLLSTLWEAQRKHRNLRGAMRGFWDNRFSRAYVIVLTGLAALAVVARLLGFAPSSYLGSAVEGTLLNNDGTLAALVFYLHARKRVPQHSG